MLDRVSTSYRLFVDCDFFWRINGERGVKRGYTYTPAEQNKATTPNPPRMLAIAAMVSSCTGTVDFGKLFWARV